MTLVSALVYRICMYQELGQKDNESVGCLKRSVEGIDNIFRSLAKGALSLEEGRANEMKCYIQSFLLCDVATV